MLVVSLLAASLVGLSAAPPSAAPITPSGTKIAGHELASFIARLKVPSFSRQTKLACSACHNGFPQLTAFGRMFKLNGYTMTGLQPIQAGDSGRRQSLRLDLIPPVSDRKSVV